MAADQIKETAPDEECQSSKSRIRTYTRRWLVLVALSVLVFTNSMSRLAFGPVAYTAASFYETEVGTINWFAIVYMVVGIPFGLVATWVMEKLGLRTSLVAAAWVNLVGCILRTCSALEGLESMARLGLVFTGHVLSAIAQPFFMFAPTKVSAVWFPDNQRAMANTIATTSNPLGILAANLLSPIIVKEPNNILLMQIVFACPAVFGALFATFVIRSNAPPLPPSESAVTRSEPFCVGLKTLAKNPQYWILFVSVGGGVGIYTAITVFLEQILCPWGYSDFFAGVVCGTCLVVAGVLGALMAGIIADRTKRFVLVAKITYLFCLGAVSMFAIVQVPVELFNRAMQNALVAVACGLIGFFGMPLFPLGNELVVETTYPAEPSTSTGLVFLSGQLQGMLLILVLQNVAKPVPEFMSIHIFKILKKWIRPTVRDMTVPCYVLMGYAILVGLVFVIFFKTDYRRITMER
uniref:Major facilitator superfamily (MFS) profile domain-containing protein n=1 Tax=Ciona intestinalis TaxID=7719 RepID=F6TYP3_CIOIN